MSAAAPRAATGDGFRWPSRLSLMLAHCAGMVDLVALPLWMGVLIGHRHLDPQQAGGLLTLFLLGVVASSLVLAPRFQRIAKRPVVTLGFAVAGLAFLAITQVTAYAAMAGLHALAGLAAGCSLSVTHGTIGRSSAPHRLFAMVSLALGAFGVVFMIVTPKAIAAHGGSVIFVVLGGVMLLAAVLAALAFPTPSAGQAAAAGQGKARLGAAVWYAVIGVSCLTLVQAMMFSFLERIGADHGFSPGTVAGVLAAMGLMCLVPGPLAALLETRWPVRRVLTIAPIVQAALAALLALSTGLPQYAVAAILFPSIIIFTHPFAFGLLARLDPTGRALAATPAMVMMGAAIAPILGGTLVKFAGYGSLAVAAAVAAIVGVVCFRRASRDTAATSVRVAPTAAV